MSEQSTEDGTRLFGLAETGDAAMLDVFLERQGPHFNVNIRNDEGETALHVAARNGKTQTCKILLRRGAELAPDAYGKTAHDLASSNGHIYCASLLRAKMEGNLSSVEADSLSVRSGLTASTSSSIPQTGNSGTLSHTASGLNSSRQEAPAQSSREASAHTGFAEDLQQADVPQNATEGAGERPKTMMVRALYNYTAAEEVPFPPDNRPEFSLTKGEQLELVHMREDGWCIVRRSRSV